MTAAVRRLRIRHRLFGGFAGVVAVMTLLSFVLVSSGLRRVLTDTFQEELARQLALGEWILGGADDADPDALAREITERVGYRVSLISPEGVVLGDSYVEPGRLDEVEDHSNRPEVQGALAGRVSFAQRTSATVAEPLLYGARLVALNGAPIVLRVAAPLTDVERAVGRAQNAVILGGLLAMMAALAIAYLVSGALSRPLVRFADLSRRLAGGDFDQRAPGDSGVPELDDLASALNRLTEELEEKLSELRQERDGMEALIDCLAEGVVAFTDDGRVFRVNRAARELLELGDVPADTTVQELVGHTELRRVLAESATRPLSAREVQFGERYLIVSSRTLDFGGAVTTLLDVTEIRRLEQVRRDFVANASHELKTPLTSIRGYAETLIEGEPPEDLKKGFLESIRKNALRLQRLVDDLLDLSRLESGGWVTRSESVSVSEVAQEAAGWYADLAADKGVHVSVSGQQEVMADRRGLGQVFGNLIENAIRHSEPGGEVRVTAVREDGSVVRVEVSDDGEGIPGKALPRIFERFYRADSSRARDFGGTGLGLAIVRHLVEGMGGGVEAHSRVGEGTTIRFTLPASAPVRESTIAGSGADNVPAEGRSQTEVFR
jgi:two-component system phosphate regulon sensor histidine kinase PhoR